MEFEFLPASLRKRCGLMESEDMAETSHLESSGETDMITMAIEPYVYLLTRHFHTESIKAA